MKYTINLFCLIIILTTNTIHAQNLTGKLEYSVTIPKTFSILKKMKNQKKSEALINFTISIEEGIKIKRPVKGKKVTQEEFEKIGENSKFNFLKMKN